jgi:hypothetical protein
MGENRAQTKETVHFISFCASMRIGGPTSKSKSAQAKEKTHFQQIKGRHMDPRAHMTC